MSIKEEDALEAALRAELKALSRHELDVTRSITLLGGYFVSFVGVASMLATMIFTTLPVIVIACIAVCYSVKYAIGSDILVALIDTIIDEYDK